jgi:peptidyl-prolyl cis-trans isomerase NIMA-interacting 1
MPPSPTGTGQNPGGREIVGAAHILVAYKGAELAPKTVTRSKGDAKKRAEEVLAKLKAEKGTFAELAQQYSDDPSKITGGAIGNFERNAMPSAFSDAAFGMPVGSVSDIVETPRGFHIIQRTR